MSGAYAIPVSDPPIRMWWGRDWLRPHSWHLVVQFFPMERLMTRVDDEGRLLLVALEIEIGARASFRHWAESRKWVWCPFLRVRSDVDEITNRRAGLA